MENGADVNWRDSTGETALFGASGWGNVEVVRYLLAMGARHDFAEAHGYTALHWVASHGNVETIEALLEAGANPHVRDATGRTPLEVAGADANRVCLLRFSASFRENG